RDPVRRHQRVDHPRRHADPAQRLPPAEAPPGLVILISRARLAHRFSLDLTFGRAAAITSPSSRLKGRRAKPSFVCKLLPAPAGAVDGGRKHWLDTVARCAVCAAGKA